ncbi:hypothetical protein D9757_009318 [Collybiopsis confluens]|uniref:DUF6534 domain-containing protein n=1 Tax=Collybiopsis confluens TaxID=2823264 RepID=A0A8H5M0I1_9AGAR|nr:hypothetical protein D9757_009318 [Collybiopsis confluens]
MSDSPLTNLFGSGLIGIVLASTLFGLYSAQAYSYFNYYTKDRLWFKLLVVFIWVVLSLEYALTLRAIYKYLIDDFGLTGELAVASWEWLSYVLLTSVTSICVQLFFARRLFYLLRNKYARYILLVGISTLSVVNFVFGVYVTARCLILKFFANFVVITWGVDLWLGANVACDILITLSMLYGLHTSRTGIKSTNHLINRLMTYSIQTGAVTSITEIFCLAAYTASGFHFGHILVVFPLSGLYATSFLANLHARAPNTPGLTRVKGLVVTDGDVVEMNQAMSFASFSDGTKVGNIGLFLNSKKKTATSHSIGFGHNNNKTKGSIDGPIHKYLDDTISEEDMIVKPARVHTGSSYESDAGSIV